MRQFKLGLVILLSVFLFACASSGDKTGKGAGDGANGPQASGISSDANFDGSGQTYEQLLAQKTVLFDFNSTDVKSDYTPLLAAHAKYLQEHADQQVLLAGNTDVRGSREYNMGLGERRASSVADVLTANGISASRLVKVSYGSEIPVACGQDEAAYAQNRRVDILYCTDKDCTAMAKSYANKNFARITASSLALIAGAALAAPVVDVTQQSDDQKPLVQQTQAPNPATSDTNAGPLQLVNRMNDLQQQVEVLQGQNEILRHELQQLDQRVTAVESGTKPTTVAAATAAAAATVTASPPADDSSAYQKAYNYIAAGQYDQAVSALQAFVQQYPQSQFVPNAIYWQGEVLAAQGKNAPASQAFNQVIQQFPNSAKVPDSLFKLAMISLDLGQKSQAKQQLQSLVKKYPNSSAAALANNQLRQMK